MALQDDQVPCRVSGIAGLRTDQKRADRSDKGKSVSEWVWLANGSDLRGVRR